MQSSRKFKGYQFELVDCNSYSIRLHFKGTRSGDIIKALIKP